MLDPYKLAEKYFKGLCSPEEAEAFLKWYFSEHGEEEIRQKIDVFRSSKGRKPKGKWDPSSLFQRIQSSKDRSSLFVSHKLDSDRLQDQKAVVTEQVRTTQTLSHRWRYMVASAIVLMVLGLGVIAYRFVLKDHSPSTSVLQEYIYKSNPAGQKSTIFLKDGSQIVLNSASGIQYPAKFPSHERVIQLRGEAFFDVARDTLRPFRVIVNGTEVTALGTSFNIRSFADENEVRIALVTGRVKVKDRTTESIPIYLNPGEGIVYSEASREMKKVTVDLKKLIAWKDGTLLFEDEPIDEVLKTLERWYGVEFVMENRIEGIFTGKFENQSLEAVLEGISYSFSLNYDINGKYVQLNLKHNKK